MTLVPSFAVFVQALSLVMTTPTYANVEVITSGWLLASRHTITGCLLAAGSSARKHHGTYHRVFAGAKWSLDEAGLLVFVMVLSLLRTATRAAKGTVFLCVDDTLLRKRGKTMYGTGMHYDPLLSSEGTPVMHRGHSWVVLGVLVRCPTVGCLKGRVFCLPILFRLYRNKVTIARKGGKPYMKRSELALQMVALLCGRFPDLAFHLVCDSAYGGQAVVKALPANCQMTSRLGADARLFDAPAPKEPGMPGRPRKRGDRLPTPKAMLALKGCPRLICLHGYNERATLADGVARTYDVPDRPIKVVAVKMQSLNRPLQVFFSTCLEAEATQILVWYAYRWSIEMTFQETKQELGIEEPQAFSRQAVLRTAPFCFLLYTFIVLWFAGYGYALYAPPDRPWYQDKSRASFADILTTLRQSLLLHQVFSLQLPKHAREKTSATLKHLAQSAM